MQKEQGYHIFLDTSGSVGNSPNYWQTVDGIFTLYAKDIKEYYFWNTNLQNTDKKGFEKAILAKKGGGGTSPEVVAKKIVDSSISKIILVTDGQVSDHSVKHCDQILQKYKLQESICYIISSGSGEVNMSVTCAFTRNCKSQVFTKLKDRPMEKLANYTPEDFKTLDKLDEITLENFDSKYELLQSLIIALNMGKAGNIPLKNEIVVMKNRLLKEYSKKVAKKSPVQALRISLQEKDIYQAMEYTKTLVKEYYGGADTSDLEKRISHLINLCGDLTGKYNIKEIKSNKMAIAKDAKQGKLDKEVETTDLSKNLIECPIILDSDVPQILIDEGEPLLLGIEKNIVDDIVACPLRILNYPQIKEKFKARLSNFTGIKYSQKIVKNPFTQNILLGAIPLGTHHSHVKVGNYTLAKMLTGGKVLGNLNMYYAVVWYLIKEGNIQYLNDILPNASEHLVYRLKNSNTMASLCGLGQFVTTEVPTDVAVWFCVNNCFLNPEADKDIFRFHIFNIDPLLEMLKLLNYPLVKGVEEHLRRTKLMLNMLSRIKKFNTNQKKSFSYLMQCLYQKGIYIDPKKLGKKFIEKQVCIMYIPIDGAPDEAQLQKIYQTLPVEWRKSPIEEIYYISTKVNAQLSAADILIDFNVVIPPLPKYQVLWSYGLKQFPYHQIKICPKTLRPCYIVKDKLWEIVAQQVYGIKPSLMIKGNKYYEHFILKHQRRPKTVQQFAIFLFNRYVESGKIKTLPFLTEQWCGDLMRDYDVVFNKIEFDFQKVKKILEESMPILKREKIESE